MWYDVEYPHYMLWRINWVIILKSEGKKINSVNASSLFYNLKQKIRKPNLVFWPPIIGTVFSTQYIRNKDVWNLFMFSEIAEGIAPRHRFMSAYEQKVEPPDRKWQYLLFAAEPYETIAFKVS